MVATYTEKLKLSIFMCKTANYLCHCETILLKCDSSMSKLLTRQKVRTLSSVTLKFTKIPKIQYKTSIVRIEPEVLEPPIIKVFYYHYFFDFMMQ